MKNSYYSMLNKRIKQMKEDGKYVIERHELTSLIIPSLFNEDVEEMVVMLANFMAGLMLNQNSYRSVIKGKSIFVDMDALTSKTLAEKLQSNTEQDIRFRNLVLQGLDKIVDKLPDDSEYSQLFFAQDDNNQMFYGDEITKADLIEMIKTLQEKGKEIAEGE